MTSHYLNQWWSILPMPVCELFKDRLQDCFTNTGAIIRVKCNIDSRYIPIICKYICYRIACSTIITMVKFRSDFALTNDTPYLALAGLFREFFNEKWPRCVETVLFGDIIKRYLHGAVIGCKHFASKVWDEIAYTFLNFNNVTVEWINNFIPHCIMDVITYTCWD